jgi:hypothetical protein
MTTKILLVTALLFQMLPSQKLFHPLSAESGGSIAGKSTLVSSFPDTIKVLAILVQFQQDNDSRTSGDGRFDLSATTERIIDSPPHDSAYFADHFVFAQNYYSKASNGKQNIATTVFGKVITLKKQMKEYAPVNDNLPLVEMIKEAWYTADSLYPGQIQFQQYSMFTVFHAGVGKDIDLRASLGYDPTPLDIPSLYFSLSSFQKLLGNTFQGIQLKNSSFKIPTTVVLPETEVRRIPSVSGDVVLKLSINGLLIASIGSHLGLPDLFDTKTGKTAIGRFGLMDGQSIFSFAGICPPEPSAWEKIYLGWTSPIEIYGNQNLSVPAVGLYSTGNDTIYKIPISAKEYYLVENRNRDAKKNNHSIMMKWNGQMISKSFTQDEDFFTNTNIDSAYGVIVDVDELDWSLPGIINAYNDYRGGILIWHIDETIIEKNIAPNTINADPKKRGIDLEEADGSQDIGQTYDFGSPGSGSEDGSPIDYWFSGNIFPSYKNEFSDNTIPNSLTNTYAKSHITLKNFSGISPQMTFEANVGDADIQLVKVIKRKNLKFDNNDAPLAADLNGDGKQELIYTSGDSIYVLKDDLTPYLNNSTGLFYPKGGRFQPAPLRILSRSENSIIGIQSDEIFVLSSNDSNADGVSDILFSSKSSATFTTPPATYSTEGIGQSHIVVGDSIGRRINYYNVNPIMWKKDSIDYFHSQVIGLSVSDLNLYLTYSIDTASVFASPHGFGGKKILSFTSRGAKANYVLFNDNTFGSFQFSSSNELIKTFNVPEKVTGSFAVYDINNDGSVDYIIGAGDKLYIYNSNGVLVENFPYQIKDAGQIIGSPVIAKQKNSDNILLIFGSSNGHIYCIDSKAKLSNGFPLQTGGVVSSLLFWNDFLSVASTDSSIYTWRVTGLIDTAKIFWKGFLVDYSHSNYLNFTSIPNIKSSELLPKKFAYNWPNPVYSGSTNIRYFLGRSGTVKIKIVNLAGELVEELNGTSYAGMDNEVQWNISKIQSGIYFAQITASGSGEEQSQVVKIAVVK